VLNGINVLTYVLVDRSGRTGICVRAIIRQKRHSLDTFALLNATCRVFPGPRTLFTIKEIITDVAVSHLARAGNYIFVQATEISAEPKFQPRTKSLYQIFFLFLSFFFFLFFWRKPQFSAKAKHREYEFSLCAPLLRDIKIWII